ncbi:MULTISPECIES: TonB-dependent receptor domain-containing protein [Pedobacter]|uniref:TonB-dependent receptor n=1 Tax=Pedobacter heparinus (strain ATCC 13125 / DSM 2366 / CIP 104194 / JCM 7457 / NBRC 12017 / NCIMB 9290 / NRRL B-14731 / HIM 762-3) TaxID=485917 RepID=C6XYI0_PEDHD|nr:MULTISPECIES: TonB-dependent receptor [Pedobacter]ACU02447.1 TonB-dependent receptor [Pedobacter heparinus DSM 2366]MBB5440133.1 outer membrane receptor protein involved in Fe transport [Pedobacter sp. AK017]
MTNYFYKVLLLTLAFCSATITLNAQSASDGKITAKVVDAQTGETIPFASAMIINRKTKAVVKGMQTDANGNLNMTALPKGAFTFKVSYVGYQTMVRDSVAITDAHREINLGTIKMKTAKGTALKEVAITAQKSTMQLGIDKKVFSVDQSLVSEGGSASDLLQNVPSVQSDIDGNVSLRGSTGVKVLIDGKPSMIAGGNVAQILQSIPASSIESVELITNPSAKYDAEGQSGIINIVLKKNKKLGLNGSVALTAGNRDNYNANTSLSFQNNKVNIYGNYSYRYGNRLGGGYSNIQYLNPSFPTAFANQSTDSKSLDKGHNFKAGLDYYLAPKSILSFTGGFNIRDNDRNEFLNIDKLNASKNPLELSRRNNSNSGSGGSYDLSLDFVQKFKKPKEELTFNFSFSDGTNDNYQNYQTDVYNINGSDVNLLPAIQINDGKGTNRSYNIQTDYTLPVGKAGKIEAGYRSQIRYADNNTFSTNFNHLNDEYDINFALTNEFNSKDQVHALYVNFQNQVKNFGYQIGLRGEDATLDTRLGRYDNAGNLSYVPGKVAYKRLYPSIFLTQKFNADQQLQLSYSRRVNRPRGWDTNPFLDVSDPLIWRQGNPNLKPEDVHAYELSYSKYWKKITFISTAYMRQTNDVIQRIRTEADENGITIVTPRNLTRELSSGLELIARVDAAKAWNFTGNVNLYQRKLDGVPQFGIVDNSGFSWNANLTNNFILPYNITMQVKGDYRSREIMAQGRRNAMYAVDAGARYDFKNKKSSLSLNVRDVFNTRRWSMTTGANNAITDFRRYMQGTMASLTYAYRFGKNDFNFKKTKKSDQQEMRSDEESF